MKNPIYLDYAATTPVDPRVAQRMADYLTQEGHYGNPSSAHPYGKKAREAVENARMQVAELINADPSEIIWTSGATEANNLALKGAAQLYRSRGKHIITLKTEHPAVLDCCQFLEKEGFSVTYLAPEKNGLLDLEKLQNSIRHDTMLVSIMHVNNELGTQQNIQAIAEITKRHNIIFHTDAAQSAGKVPIDVQTCPVDLISFSAHKIYGPKGIGALYVRKKPRVRVAAQIHGGGHEQGMRSGTLATHQIVGMGEAFVLAKQRMMQDQTRITELKHYFLAGLKNTDFTLNSSEYAIPNIINLRFNQIKSVDLIQALLELAFSAGSACLSKGIEPSYVLRTLGQTEAEAACGVRFSLGRFTTKEELDSAITQIRAVVSQHAFQSVPSSDSVTS